MIIIILGINTHTYSRYVYFMSIYGAPKNLIEPETVVPWRYIERKFANESPFDVTLGRITTHSLNSFVGLSQKSSSLMYSRVVLLYVDS